MELLHSPKKQIMKRSIIKTSVFVKGIFLLVKPHLFLGWFRNLLMTISNTLSLTRWIANQSKEAVLNDFYSLRRDYSKRYLLYQFAVDVLHLQNEPIDYLEFGVSGGNSFKWWLNSCQNDKSNFFGFDTFEGLPESWGTFNKGDMSASIPVVEDHRAKFIKGLFQDTVQHFLSRVNLKNGKRKIIHLDADLFSSTLFVLTSLAPYIKKGDILLFDEFNVPNHEFFAFKLFCDSYYVRTKLLGSVNNYYQVVIMIE